MIVSLFATVYLPNSYTTTYQHTSISINLLYLTYHLRPFIIAQDFILSIITVDT